VAEQIQLLGSLLQDNRKQHRAFEDLARLWDSHQQLDSQSQALTQKQTLAQQQRELLNQSGLQAKAELAVAEQTLTVTKQLLERQRLARSASVEELRGQLQNDQPCPVCGSVEHPYHQPEAMLQSLTRHDESEEASAQQAVDVLKEKLTELRGEVGGLIAQQKEFLQQQEQLASQLQALLPALEAHPLSASLFNQGAAKRDAWLAQQLSQLSQSLTQDEQRQGALLNLQQNTQHTLIIGNAEALPASLFDASVSYVALGHLHKPQRVNGEERIRYCGSPIPLSFSEIGYQHQILDVQLDGETLVSVESRLIPRSVNLQRLEAAPLADILKQLAELPDIDLLAETQRQPWLEVRVFARGR